MLLDFRQFITGGSTYHRITLGPRAAAPSVSKARKEGCRHTPRTGRRTLLRQASSNSAKHPCLHKKTTMTSGNLTYNYVLGATRLASGRTIHFFSSCAATTCIDIILTHCSVSLKDRSNFIVEKYAFSCRRHFPHGWSCNVASLSIRLLF